MDAIRVAKVTPVILDRTVLDPPYTTPARQRLDGTLHLTPHHLIFSPSPPQSSLPSAASTSPSTLTNSTAAATTTTTGTTSSTIPTSSSTNEIWIPYPTIVLLARLPQTIDGLYPLSVGTKTFESYTLLFAKDREGGAEDVWQSVRDCAVAASIEQLYGFFYALPPPTPAPSSLTPLAPASPSPPASGWNSYNPRAEFARQGVGSRTKAWRFTDINRDYSLCPTYPAKLVVPSRISDSVLAYAAKYRSKGRIPALTYLHWANNASITRSSQPMVGLKNARSAQDERLIECIFTTHQFQDTAYAPSSSNVATPYGSSAAATSTPLSPSSSSQSLVYGATTTNLIIDARPTANAVANVAKGAGTENMEWYKLGKKAYMGIDNIHVMRNSLKAIIEAVREAETTSFPVDRERLRKSGWLRHISSVLDGSVVIVRNVHIASSHVLIHCSDGWDRTSQLSAVAQICLDPYYRTFEGFKVLVEKDWLSFGHMFNQRSGHLSSDKLFTATPDNIDGDEEEDENEFGGAVKGAQAFFGMVSKQFASNSHLKETSPVFHQFLDCVWQIHRQYPDRFEFNEDFLLAVHYHLYACQFGTFLFDSERERRVPSSGGKPYVDRTVSAWEWLDRVEQREAFKNDKYDPKLDDKSARDSGKGDMGVLLPDPRDVRFWYRLFKRGDDEMNGVKRIDVPQGPGATDVSSDPLAQSFPTPGEASIPASGQSGGANNAPGPGSGPVATNKDTFRPFTSTSSAFSLQPQLGSGVASGASPLQTQSAFTPNSSSPFDRVRSGISGISGGSAGSASPGLSASGASGSSGGQWSWGQLSSGARSALNQIKTMSVDAIGQLRAEVGEIDGDMWRNPNGVAGAASTGTAGVASTTVGSGSESFPKTSFRIPSEANPWSISSTSTSTDKPLPPTTSAQVERPAQLAQPERREVSLSSNPWDEPVSKSSASGGNGGGGGSGSGTNSATRSLADLRLGDELRPQPRSAPGRAGATTPTPGLASTPVSATATSAPSAAPKAKSADEEMLEAAMGGDRKAWDPLGAL